MEKKYPKLGTGIVIFNNKNQILFGKRTYTPVGYQIVGGHIEYFENIEQSCKREALEEAGIDIENIEIKAIGENIFKDKDYHSVTVFCFCTIKDGQEPVNMEPNKCDGWEWFDIENIPSELSFNYQPILKNDKKLLKEYINKINNKGV